MSPVGKCRGGEMSRWGNVAVGNCRGGEVSRWGNDSGGNVVQSSGALQLNFPCPIVSRVTECPKFLNRLRNLSLEPVNRFLIRFKLVTKKAIFRIFNLIIDIK